MYWYRSTVCSSCFNEKLVYKRICAMYDPIFLKHEYKIEAQCREMRGKERRKKE